MTFEPIFRKLIYGKIQNLANFFSNYLSRFDIKVDSLVLLNILFLLKEDSVLKSNEGLTLTQLVFEYYSNLKFNIINFETKKLDKYNDFISYDHVNIRFNQVSTLN
jgi:hypothetical protein